MIIVDLWLLSHPAALGSNRGTLAKCEEWRDRNPLGRPAEEYKIERVACCGCCGTSDLGNGVDSIATYPNGSVRCSRHHGRNPCAIEGCARTRAAPISSNGFPWHADDMTLCSDHWRRYVPARSRIRRAYNSFFREAKRHSWDYRGKTGRKPRLEYRFRQFWKKLVAQARRRATEGHIDEAAICRLMGWDAPGG